MSTAKGLFVALLVACLCARSQSYTLPASGLYMSLSNTALLTAAEDVTSEVVTEVNGYTGWPAESGTSSSASYTFQNWQVAIALVDPQWKVIGTNELAVGWHTLNFTIEADYHVCATSWPNPCEDGNLYIYTTNPYTQMYVDIVMDLDQSPPFFNVTASTLDFTNNGILIYVQCSDTFCLIPVDDIADAVAQDFVSLFTAAVAKAANDALSKYITNFNTQFNFADGLGIDLQNNWWVLPGNDGYENGLIFVPSTGGFFTDVSGTITYPPFAPFFTPPQSFLQWPTQDIDITITSYLFESLAWGLAGLNVFDKTITSSEVPSDSPVQLSTNDPFFQQVVPGLAKLPNMDITVTTKLIEMAVPTIDAKGLHFEGSNITIDFALSNSSYSQHGWTLSNIFNIDLLVNASILGSDIVFNASITNFNASVVVAETNCGNITAAGFATLYQLLESVVKVPGFVFKLPGSFAASSPTITFYSDYIGVGATLAISEENANQSPQVLPVKPSGNVLIV